MIFPNMIKKRKTYKIIVNNSVNVREFMLADYMLGFSHFRDGHSEIIIDSLFPNL